MCCLNVLLNNLFFRVYDILQGISSVAMFIQFLGTSLSQITLVFYISNVDSSMAYILLLHMSVIVGEVFFPCYLGNLIVESNENLATSIYFCNWVGQSIRFQKTLQTMIIRVNRENRLFAGTFIPITLESFLEVRLS